jgi:hypothetical protein
MKPHLGSVEWIALRNGRLSLGERLDLVAGLFGAYREGLGLWWRARKGKNRSGALSRFEPPDTPMVAAARDYLVTHSGRPMVNHCFRTAFWTLFALNERAEVGERDRETTWVAALLHDVGLEHPPARGDFSLGGVQVLERLADQHRWSSEQTRLASEAIATNLNARVDPKRVGEIAWAMNVGGLGELGFWPHRAQLHPDRIAELEARFPRDGFRAEAMRLIREEVRRVPGGRFAFFRHLFPILMR